MKTSRLWVLVPSLILAGCSHSVPPAETLDKTVGQLDHSLSHLSAQSLALAAQHRMNAGSTHGAWLVPLAQSPVELVATDAKLLLQLAPASDGDTLQLVVKNAGRQTLPPFALTAIVAVVSVPQSYRPVVPPVSKQQELQQTRPLPAGASGYFPLPAVTVQPQQSLRVNVHQFRRLE